MIDARVVANFMLDAADRRGIRLSNLSLQKLLYFAHAIALTERKRPLIAGYFEAWQYGPVQPIVYQAFKDSGSDDIAGRAMGFDPVARKSLPLPALDDPIAIDICNRVIFNFGHLSAGRLVDITHAPDGPWHFVVSSAKEGANIGLRIPDSVIAERHGRQKVSVQTTPRVGEPDEDSPFA